MVILASGVKQEQAEYWTQAYQIYQKHGIRL